MTAAIAEEGELQRQWAPAMWASLCLHLIIVGALQPAASPTEDRFSERAIEVTVERATPPPAPAAAPTAAPTAAMTRAEFADSAPAPAGSDGEKPVQTTAAENTTATPTVPPPAPAPPFKLEEAVALPQPPLAVDSRELAPVAPATAPRSSRQPPPQKASKPPAASANQHQALQDYVLQVVRKLSAARFYAASPSAQNGHGVVVARLTVGRDGRLVDLSLPKQSGLAGVDGSVLDAIRRSAPFAPLPEGFTENRFTFIVPINYTVER